MTDTVHTEFCVVGAGPAGAVLASVLARNGKKVLLLEQGPSYGPEARTALLDERNRRLLDMFSLDFGDQWPADFDNARVATIGKTPWDYLSVAGVGGTSLHWAASTPRPIEDDMRVRTRFGHGRDWPISYAELEPWLLRAEHEIGVSANADNPYASPRSGDFPMPAPPFSHFERTIFAPAAQTLGWTAHSRPNAVNSVARDGRPACMACRACSACPSGAKYTADRVHVPRLVAAPTGKLMTGVKLLRLECAGDGRRIARAHAVRMEDRAELVIEADVFVLAMGAVETPRMLLLSRDDRHHPDGLGNAGGQVGAGFSDHLMNLFWMVLDQPTGNALGYPAMGCDHFRPNAPRDQHGSFYLALYPVPYELDWVPAEMFSRLATRGNVLSLDAMRKSFGRGVAGFTMHEMGDTHRLDLDPVEKDAFGNALPRVNMSLTDWERAGPLRALRMLADMAGAFGAEVGEAWSQGFFAFAGHPSGGTAMGRSREDGVCDVDCRVFGLDNLYVASSSVFPHQGANNPTLTIVALALRLAAQLGRT